jgi:hypothetical protein
MLKRYFKAIARRSAICLAGVCAHFYVHMSYVPYPFFFSLYVFGFFVIFSSVALHRGQPAAKCHPRWQPSRRLAVCCGLGRRWIRTRDCRTTIWRDTIGPPCLHIEPPRLSSWATTPFITVVLELRSSYLLVNSAQEAIETWIQLVDGMLQ